MPLRLTGLSSPTDTACCASVDSDVAIGSLVKWRKVRRLGQDGRLQSLAEQRGQLGVGRLGRVAPLALM